MPQLDRRGKWVFGWVVVGPRREIAVPPEARREYGFRAGQRISFLVTVQRSFASNRQVWRNAIHDVA